MANENKNYGPSVVAVMLGTCIASYIEYGVTKNEVVGMVEDVYSAIVDQLPDDIEPGFGKLTNDALDAEAARFAHMVSNGQLPEDHKEALWFLVGQVESMVKRLKEAL